MHKFKVGDRFIYRANQGGSTLWDGITGTIASTQNEQGHVKVLIDAGQKLNSGESVENYCTLTDDDKFTASRLEYVPAVKDKPRTEDDKERFNNLENYGIF